MRLLGFERVELEPGQSRRVTLSADPRPLARFKDGQWHIAEGAHRVAVGKSAGELVLTSEALLSGQRFGR